MNQYSPLTYFEENEYVHSLPERQFGVGEPVSFKTRSTYTALRLQAKAFISWARWGIWAINRVKSIKKLKMKKGTAKGKRALLLGNGPSQESLPLKVINEFVNSGGELIVCNFFQNNPYLQQNSPSIYVSSDPHLPLTPEFVQVKKILAGVEKLQIFVPENDVQVWSKEFPRAEVTGFCDMEITQGIFRRPRRINPIYPRSYQSLTLFKALAIACWAGYSEIYILGMDNTYPRDIFCDEHNNLIQRERHAMTGDFKVNRSIMFSKMSDYVYAHSLIFEDLENFADFPIVNLDPYSLTDSFQKVPTYEEGWDLLTKKNN